MHLDFRFETVTMLVKGEDRLREEMEEKGASSLENPGSLNKGFWLVRAREYVYNVRVCVTVCGALPLSN